MHRSLTIGELDNRTIRAVNRSNYALAKRPMQDGLACNKSVLAAAILARIVP
jgi:hypothetical protein